MDTNSTKSVGYVEHTGRYSILLTETADKSVIPTDVVVKGNHVAVRSGVVKQEMAGFRFWSGNTKYFLAYTSIRWIKDDGSNVLWENKDLQGK